jgi:D-tyrosyl-tRNA(Tyr) deacylase
VRAVVQRVSEASVRVTGELAGEIGPGLVVLLGVQVGDGDADADALAEKVLNLRIFPDEAGHMNRSVLETRGGLLVVSQFTLLGDARKGRRPSFIDAARPEEADRLYLRFVERLRLSKLAVATSRSSTRARSRSCSTPASSSSYSRSRFHSRRRERRRRAFPRPPVAGA